MLVALWSALNPGQGDAYEGVHVKVRITVPDVKRVTAVDTLQCLTQQLEAHYEGDELIVDGVLVMDYPLVLKLER